MRMEREKCVPISFKAIEKIKSVIYQISGGQCLSLNKKESRIASKLSVGHNK